MNPESYESTFFLALRRMRAPLITLIVIYAVSILGLTLIPGLDAEGNPSRMSFLHAFYFISYTATTIGFGEIPNAFSEAQRMWVTLCIYLSVIGWAYSIGALLALLQDQNFRNAVRLQRFGRAVRNMREPFYLVCGYGETGQLLCRALDQLGVRAIVIEVSESRVSQLDLHGHSADIPALAADASQPEILKLAGLTHRYCRGVIALTNDDSANLAIAIAVRLLASQLTTLCRVEALETAANMASFGTRHIINPFDKFGRYLALALHAPAAYHLLEWLTAVPGTKVEPHRDPPRGHWVLCGYGRFGKVLVSALEQENVPITIIDHDPPLESDHRHWVRGDGSGAPALLEAGIQQAVGIVASTNDDVNNLSIVVTARKLNARLFVVLRQNLQAHQALFDAFESDFTVVPSQIIARECLAILTTPLLAPFLWQIKQRGESWASTLLDQLTSRFGWETPTVWSVRIDAAQAPALMERLKLSRIPMLLGDLLRNPHDRAQELDCRALYLVREDDTTVMLPHRHTSLQAGDQLLLVGRREARGDLELTLNNENTLEYVLRGREIPGGWVWEQLARIHARRPDSR
ncbi:MAG: NAD-binding protein [Candidatus Competibacteraceae bacterium]|nr:NAD-binding protein [Candidatus Competibacteraceae bacterium]HRY15594.1 NAD-binding protein [Candidatus Competibacteraceae bacterium]